MTVQRYIISLLGVGMLAIAVGLILHAVVIPGMVHKNSQVRVPDILEYTADDAFEITSSAGLQLRVLRREFHSSLPEGVVIEQFPIAGNLVREGRPLSVVVSKGHFAFRVPMLTGLDQRKAENTIQRESFKVGDVSRLKLEGVGSATVLWQYPASGKQLRKGESVDIVIAEPSEYVSYCMPDLTGQTIYSARAKVELAGCVIAPVKYERRPNLRPNTVVAQKPAYGSRLIKGETIELVASTR
jgi:eukaryotic-like serine/threonine-protein kinase